VAFDVAAEAYARFMGRYAEPLADQFLELACVRAGQRALDVGCGPGALTSRLVARLGAAAVAAVDPSTPFVAAARERCPGADVRPGVAEELPFADASYDVALAQLVVHFMTDPVQGLREMGRVVTDNGVVAACVWDHAGGAGPLATFWTAVRELDADAPDESGLAGTREGHLADLAEQAGLRDVRAGRLTVAVPYASFEEWWQPYTLGVGPAGDHVAGLDEGAREELRTRCAERLPAGPFEIEASAWTVVATR
jgi:SAM-dependent methyltransferase